MNQLIEFRNKQGSVLRGVIFAASNKNIVVCVHGFERTSVTEKKFKVLSDELLKQNISSFRFDFIGTGLSDGDFRSITVAGMADNLKAAIDEEKKYGRNMSIFAHSLGACVLAKYIQNHSTPSFQSIVLLAPALN